MLASRRSASVFTWGFLTLATVLAACGPGSSGNDAGASGSDGGASDGGSSLLDGAHVDGTLLDGAHVDGTLLDGAHVDGTSLDGAFSCGASMCADGQLCMTTRPGDAAGPAPMGCTVVPAGCAVVNCYSTECPACIRSLCGSGAFVSVMGRTISCDYP